MVENRQNTGGNHGETTPALPMGDAAYRLERMNLLGATGVPVGFEVRDAKPSTVLVSGQDGQIYEVKVALMISNVIEQPMRNPIDGLPIFQLGIQPVIQVRLKAND